MEPTPDGPDGPLEFVGNLLVTPTLPVGQQDRDPLRFGKPFDLGSDPIGSLKRLQVAGHWASQIAELDRIGRLLPIASPTLIGPRPPSQPTRHSSQPRSEPISIADRLGPTRKDHKGRLEDIVSVSLVPENRSDHAPDHRPMTTDQHLEGRRIARRTEPRQELGVAQTPQRDDSRAMGIHHGHRKRLDKVINGAST